MKQMVRVVFTIEPKRASKILDPIRMSVNPKSDDQAVVVARDSTEYEYLIRELRNQGVDPIEFPQMHFDSQEVENAEFLRIVPAGYWGYPQPEEDFDLYRKESYDTSAKCNMCGNGSIQDRPLLVKGKPKFGKSDILAIHWEYEFLVTARLKLLIEKADLTGTDFWPILDSKKRKRIEGFYQLHITSELSPMSSNTQFEAVELDRIKSPCHCGRAGRNLAYHQMVYRRADMKSAKDFNKTHEWLGGGYGTTQWKVVSKRVYRLFKDSNIKRVTFQPVIIEE